MKINWKEKLTSRKFWAAVIAFVTAILSAFCIDELTITKVAAVIAAEGALVAYIFMEGKIDVARLKAIANCTVNIEEADELDYENWSLEDLIAFCKENSIYTGDCVTREENIETIDSMLEEELNS